VRTREYPVHRGPGDPFVSATRGGGGRCHEHHPVPQRDDAGGPDVRSTSAPPGGTCPDIWTMAR